MQVESLKVGVYRTNCYILRKNDHVLVIDPGFRSDKICAAIGDDRISAVLLTHGHLDHIGAVDELIRKKPSPVYVSIHDADMLRDPYLNCSNQNNIRVTSPVIQIAEGKLVIEDFEIMVFETPGHTAGSLTFLIDNKLFTGDTLFKESVGRTDLPTGNARDLKQSLQLFHSFPDDYTIYPGHDEISSLKHELISNPYL
ncbi:MAG: MBL fold metallo-hydrolase [Erysipelotrichaceae bacterium]|nr:MBL fold metallo-hydrolase [Erysipelotrichaceae bacterium]